MAEKFKSHNVACRKFFIMLLLIHNTVVNIILDQLKNKFLGLYLTFGKDCEKRSYWTSVRCHINITSSELDRVLRYLNATLMFRCWRIKKEINTTDHIRTDSWTKHLNESLDGDGFCV